MESDVSETLPECIHYKQIKIPNKNNDHLPNTYKRVREKLNNDNNEKQNLKTFCAMKKQK